MKLTEARLKQLILEMMEDEEEMTPEEKEKMIKSLGVLIKTGKWDSINQAIFLADTAEPPLPVPWDLLPLRDMNDADLVELAKHLLDNTDVSGFRTKTMLRKGVEGMIGDKKNAGRQYVIMAIEKLF